MDFSTCCVNNITPGIDNNSSDINFIYNDIAGVVRGNIITGGEIECIIS